VDAVILFLPSARLDDEKLGLSLQLWTVFIVESPEYVLLQVKLSAVRGNNLARITSMGGNADDGHIGITVRYRVRKLDNFDQCLISSEILSHEHCETKLLEEALKASCVLRGPIPLCIEGWASKSFVVYDKGKTPWHGNHGVDLVKVGEKYSSWLHFNSESAVHLQSPDIKTLAKKG